ncbi:MAG: PH domain-containing protein [Mycobacteriales bacterium]
MAYPERALASDEKVVRHLHPHWITMILPVLALIIAAGLGSFLIAILPGGGAHLPLLIVVLVVAIAVLVWFFIIPFLRWRTTHYVVTTHRVLIRTGILNHVGHDIQLQRINDVGFRQNIWERMIGAGSITIESASEHGQEILEDVPHADDVQQLLNQLVEADSIRRESGGRSATAGGASGPRTDPRIDTGEAAQQGGHEDGYEGYEGEAADSQPSGDPDRDPGPGGTRRLGGRRSTRRRDIDR